MEQIEALLSIVVQRRGGDAALKEINDPQGQQGTVDVIGSGGGALEFFCEYLVDPGTLRANLVTVT